MTSDSGGPTDPRSTSFTPAFVGLTVAELVYVTAAWSMIPSTPLLVGALGSAAGARRTRVSMVEVHGG